MAVAKPKIVAMIVGSAIIMQQIDSTVITTALPQMPISFHSDPVNLSVAVTAYLLSLAVFVPVSGWAADRFGGRTIFRAAIALFTLGSILCGLSGNAVQLTAARVLQGLGGAMMVPVGRLVLFRSVEKSELIGTLAYCAGPVPFVCRCLLSPGAALFCLMYSIEAFGRGRGSVTELVVLLVAGVAFGTL